MIDISHDPRIDPRIKALLSAIEDPSFVDGHFTLRVDDAPAAALDA
jgi:hypothetical protein